MPYVVLEALAAGMPMIASAVGGIPEIFGPRSPALIRPDAGMLAERLVAALADEAAFRAAMPPQADLRSRFGADVMAAKIEAIYLSALAGRS
jgi:glycosyltransferase involved in cell wall biosynthesis